MIKYYAKFRQNDHLLKVLKNSFKQIQDNRWLILLLIKNQNKITYQRDILGLAWLLIMPLVPILAYIFLASIKVFNTVKEMPFVFYIVVGMFIWLLMSSIIKKTMLSIKAEKNILRSTNLPMLVVMVSKMGEILFDSFIRFFAVIVIVVWQNIDIPIISILYFILSLIPIIICSFAIGAIVAIVNLVSHDIEKAVDIFLRYGLFVSSVIFPFPDNGLLGIIGDFNIFNTYVNGIRDILFYGTVQNFSLFGYTVLVTLFLFILSLKLVYIFDYKVREYL